MYILSVMEIYAYVKIFKQSKVILYVCNKSLLLPAIYVLFSMTMIEISNS